MGDNGVEWVPQSIDWLSELDQPVLELQDVIRSWQYTMSMRNGLTGTPSLLPLHLDRRIPCWIGLDASRRAPVPAPVCCCWNLWPLLTRVLIFLERPRNETLNLGVLKCQNVNSHQLSSHQLNSHQPISHQPSSHHNFHIDSLKCSPGMPVCIALVVHARSYDLVAV